MALPIKKSNLDYYIYETDDFLKRVEEMLTFVKTETLVCDHRKLAYFKKSLFEIRTVLINSQMLLIKMKLGGSFCPNIAEEAISCIVKTDNDFQKLEINIWLYYYG